MVSISEVEVEVEEEKILKMDYFRSKLERTQNENVFEVEEILTNILLRLPVKSLLMCKDVCKYWRGLICSRSFMHLHLIQSQENPAYVFYPPPDWGFNVHLLTKTDGETTQSFPGSDRFYFEGMICSFNGLICCIDIDRFRTCNIRRSSTLDIRISNPATGEVLLLPLTTGSKWPPKVGVSFGPTINEYKVFYFFYRQEVHHFGCKVYSSITGSWKSIGSVAHWPFTSRNHVCINGIVYWFSKSRIDGRMVGHILAVDTEEKFSIIRIPDECTLCPFLVNLEDCLCLVAVAENGLQENESRFDIWALQDSKESVWVKKWSDYMPISKIKRVDYVAVQKIEILFRRWKQYLFYNMGTRTWRELNWQHGVRIGLSFPVAYTESLLPCNGRIDS